jgi:hypothetical protein
LEIKRNRENIRAAANIYLRTRWEGNQSTREALSRAAEANALIFVKGEPFILLSGAVSLEGLPLRQAIRKGGIVTLSSKNILNICLRVESLNSTMMSHIRFKEDLIGSRRDRAERRSI